MSHTNDRKSARRASRRLAGLGLAVALLFAGACDNILDVDLPGNVEADALNNPAFAQTLVLGAQNDLECAVGVYIQSASLWATELIDASTWATLRQWQTRIVDSDGGGGDCPEETFRGGGTYGPYGQLQTARGQAITAKNLITGFTGLGAVADTLIATSEVYQGYATLILGEAYCQMRLDPTGPLLTPDEAIDAARDLFEAAIPRLGGNIQNLARVGLARSEARLGNLPAADAAAAAVPAGFAFNLTYAGSPIRRNNFVNIYNFLNNFTSVDADFRNLTVGSAPDTRVAVTLATGSGSVPNDGVTPVWRANLYSTAASPIRLGSYVEAQLIRAEAALAAGNPATAEGYINAVRTAYSLPNYATSPGGTVTMAQLLEERRRTLFLQTHRLGDLLNYNLPFKWSGGVDHKNRPVTTNTCFDLPDAELSGG
jgi:hypothetical protein